MLAGGGNRVVDTALINRPSAAAGVAMGLALGAAVYLAVGLAAGGVADALRVAPALLVAFAVGVDAGVGLTAMSCRLKAPPGSSPELSKGTNGGLSACT